MVHSAFWSSVIGDKKGGTINLKFLFKFRFFFILVVLSCYFCGFDYLVRSLQMGIISDKLDIDFVTGDNFYDEGLTGVDDPAFDDSFKYVYAARSLKKQRYIVLGNNDYGGDVEPQLARWLTERDSRWRCLRSFIVNTATTPFVNMFLDDPKHHKYDWRGILLQEVYHANLLKDLRSALSESKTKWKIVVGQYGIRTTSHHCDTPELVTHLLPLLEVYTINLNSIIHWLDDHKLVDISNLFACKINGR